MKKGKHQKTKEEEREERITRKSKLETNKSGKRKAKKKKSLKKKVISLIFIICIVALVGVGVYLANDFITSNKDKGKMQDAQKYMDTENSSYEEQIEKFKQMQANNSNIKSWIKIDDTKINYPVLQSEDNEYYISHDYEDNENKYGSIFLKATCDVDDVNSNLMIYGHHMRDGEMFTGIMQYENKSFWENHNVIHLITDSEVREYKIMAAFRSRVFYKKETGVFRFYNYLKFKNEKEYNEYIDNVKKIQLYDTGVTAKYGEQLLTLITCEYSQDNGRFVVVAKRMN